MFNLRIVKRNAVSGIKPGTAFKDRLEITVDSAGTVIDEFENIADVPELIPVEL
jgi:hypothetical protein